VDRGNVYLPVLVLPDRQQGGTATREVRKFVVSLQGGDAFKNADDVAVVVCSTNRKEGRSIRPFEVAVGPTHGFDTDTIIDCRWVHTIPKSHTTGCFKFQLPRSVMNDVSAALVVGLQM
jgi:mRNA-degrading endonuclease toxin of MazEF toxin-antitoxin module